MCAVCARIRAHHTAARAAAALAAVASPRQTTTAVALRASSDVHEGDGEWLASSAMAATQRVPMEVALSSMAHSAPRRSASEPRSTTGISEVSEPPVR